MVSVRRWWNSKLLQLGVLTVLLSGAWMLRQTQGHLLLEMYQLVSRPFQMLQTGPSPEERLNDSRFWELQTRIADLESENQNLENLLGYVEKAALSSDPIIARVVGRSADHWWQQVILNRGSKQGVKAGFIVQADGGLVGLVESVTPNTSRVLLISDLKNQVGVTINRSSAKGILRGDSSAEAVLEFYEKIPDVKVGDLISTSTYSQKFPAGVPVGRIKSLNFKQSPASLAKVELLPPILSLDWVAIYPFAPITDELESTNSELVN
ncbi:rod shape-determining protein MreC [Nodularia harveyana UHCC-0300]|uniref:Cell shape-determining protein MreC n=1 Tax=Nodularia harveyana UHCC-0300 TaxID=2974287 RepID=A0ABU5UJU5_9CYAN|nr:rod shape-determining protein MreC [Nodularia harveyana]MEA5583479.1 rod shape-determining protein MreC [Nodularia harveyana UHCC-0300]